MYVTQCQWPKVTKNRYIFAVFRFKFVSQPRCRLFLYLWCRWMLKQVQEMMLAARFYAQTRSRHFIGLFYISWKNPFLNAPEAWPVDSFSCGKGGMLKTSTRAAPSAMVAACTHYHYGARLVTNHNFSHLRRLTVKGRCEQYVWMVALWWPGLSRYVIRTQKHYCRMLNIFDRT